MLSDFLTFSLSSVSLFSTIVDKIYQHVADITTLYWKVFLLIFLPLLFKAKSVPLRFEPFGLVMVRSNSRRKCWKRNIQSWVLS